MPEGTAGAEIWHCGKKAGSVSKIWAPVSPVFHLHWAWTKSFPITWGGTSELPQLWKDSGRTKTSEDRAGNYPNQQNSPVELTGQFPYLNLALNIFMIIVCNSAGSSSIATLCSSLLMVFFWKWQNLLKCFWALSWSWLLWRHWLNCREGALDLDKNKGTLWTFPVFVSRLPTPGKD